MKTTLPLLGLGVIITVNALAGPEVIIRERAKELRDQNNVRQGVAPPTVANQPPQSPPAPSAPALSPALVRFQATLAAIKSDIAPAPEQKQKLAQDLLLSAQGSKPSAAAVDKLVEDLSLAFAEKPLSSTSRARLMLELDAVLNPGKYPQAKLEGIFTDVQAIFQENGLARSRAVVISSDVKRIADEIRGSAK